MILPLFLALAPQDAGVQPAEAPVQSLVRVPAGALSPLKVTELDLDVATVRPSGEVALVADARAKTALAKAGIPFAIVHEDLAAFYASRLTPRDTISGTPPLGAWPTPPFRAGSMAGSYTSAEAVS